MYAVCFTEGHLNCFHVWAITNNAAMNIKNVNKVLFLFLWTCIFISLGYIPRCRHAGSHGNSMLNLLRSWTVFQKSCTIFHSHQPCVTGAVSPHPYWHLLVSVSDSSHPIDEIKWYLIVILTCISLMARDVWYVFMCSIMGLYVYCFLYPKYHPIHYPG